MTKRGRKLKQTMRRRTEARWPIMKWYIQWSDYVRRQHRFKRWFRQGAPSAIVYVPELHEFNRRFFLRSTDQR